MLWTREEVCQLLLAFILTQDGSYRDSMISEYQAHPFTLASMVLGKRALIFSNNLGLAHGAQAKMIPHFKSIEVKMSLWPQVSSSWKPACCSCGGSVEGRDTLRGANRTQMADRFPSI